MVAEILYENTCVLLLGHTKEEKKALEEIMNIPMPFLGNETYNAEHDRLTYLREREAKKNEILQNALARELQYFEEHPKELFSKLKEFIKKDITAIVEDKKPTDSYLESLYGNKEDPVGKYIFTSGLVYHVTTLVNNTPGAYKKLAEYISKTFETERKKLEDKAKALQEVELVKVTPKRVKKYQQPIDKISQSLFNANENLPYYDNDATDVVILTLKGKRKAQEVTTAVAIDISKLEGIYFSNGVMLDRYNKAIHDAMLSMYLAGNKGGSLNQLYKVINGNKETLKAPEEKTLKDIREAVNKLRLTDVAIDASEEAKLYGFSKAKIKNYLMPVKIVEVEINGNKAEGFVFLDEPPLYTYARQKNQINAGNIEYFNVPLNTTPENIKLTSYLFERVQGAKNEKSKLGPVILYEAIYKILELDENATKQKRSDVRKKVKEIFNTWIRAGFIEGFEEIKENSTVVKIKILL